MFKLLFSFFLALSLPSISFTEESLVATPTSTQPPFLPWTTDFDQALTMAKAQSLPIYLYFTGSSWCIWCKKMDKEIHDQDGFRQKVVGKFIFVKIDLPVGSQANDQIKELMKKYDVTGVPTVLILSPEGQEMARFRYQNITPEAFADLVLIPESSYHLNRVKAPGG